jgi:3-oxoacyl-[acyl-carrier-protein] synthase II
MANSGKTLEPRRVVVTGVGAITSQGPTAQALWDNVRDCRVAIRPVEHMSMEGFRTQVGGEVLDEPGDTLPYPHPGGFRDRAFDFALKAAEEAFEAGGVGFEYIPAERWGVVIGTCNAGLLSGEQWYKERMAGGEPDPLLVTLVPPQALAEAVSGAFGLRGPALSINTACAAGANAIGYAAELIRYGQADAVVAGGTDAFSDVLFAGFSSLESLSPQPAAPYSRDRQGLSLGEGSGMLVLVREDIARQAGATVLAEVAGYGLSADGYHPTAPHPEGKGAARAIRAALTAAGVEPEQVRYVNSHGTGTPKNDPAETAATKLGLGEAARSVAVSSTKSMIGHLLGAAGAVEGIVTVKAVEEQIAPPTANFTAPDPECDLDYVPNQARPMAIDYAISNNFAFGGANACIVIARSGARETAPPRPDYDRVVITGLATLTSGGNDPAAVWERLHAGEAITQGEDGVRLGRVNYDPTPFLSKRDTRRMDRLGIFSICATRLALEDAGLALDDSNREQVGVIFGTGVGPMESMENFSRPLFEEGPRAANPAVFPNTVYNAAGGQVAIHVGAIGPASTVTAGHAAGASALCYAADLVACGRAEAIVCLAADTLTDTVIAAYRELGVLASDNGSGKGGFALAEAGVALVLERLSHAQARGARIYGEVLGYGITSDAKGVGKLDPRGRGLERAMRIALDDAGVEPDAVSAVWTSASGHRLADAAENAALSRVFGSAPTTHAPKTLLGEPMGAGGALNAALALHGWQAQPGASGPVLVNSCSLGGTNFSVVLAPYQN